MMLSAHSTAFDCYRFVLPGLIELIHIDMMFRGWNRTRPRRTGIIGITEILLSE